MATEGNDEKIHVVGFSLGAMTAIKLAAQFPQHITNLTLIAPAAPLELGDFLPEMAGRQVFKIASKGSTSLSILTSIQKMVTALAPNLMVKALFAGSPQADQALLSDTDFRKSLISGLHSSFGPNRHAYRTAVLEYVRPWAHHTKDITCPVKIYHGSADNWAPVEMAYALKNAIKSNVDVVVFDNLGHYSTLHKVMPRIYQSGNEYQQQT